MFLIVFWLFYSLSGISRLLSVFATPEQLPHWDHLPISTADLPVHQTIYSPRQKAAKYAHNADRNVGLFE